MIDDRYYVKIVPHKGETVHRLQITRRHIFAALGFVAFVILGSLGFAALTALRAHAQVATLRAETDAQKATLHQIDRQTDALRKQLQSVQRQNQEIRQLIGAPAPAKSPVKKTSWVRGSSLPAVAARMKLLSAEGSAVARETALTRRLAMHVLNIRHLRDLARAQMIAAIPSIDPVAGAEVIGCYCYRTYPDTEFHEGVDLAADYGDTVRAAAAGTVVANSYDGGYGIKVDIDHGNGYHTWYAHLSRAEVRIGQHVYKGEPIAAVG